MCTLIVFHRCVAGTPLVVAANRDEFYDRPAASPAFLPHPIGTQVLAPRDLRAGGTWWGLNQNGVFAGLTNRPHPAPDTTRRSRGLLVMDALGYRAAAKAAAAFESLRSGQYNPFNLVIADHRDAFTVVCNGGDVRVEALEPGVHVVGNAEPNDLEHEKTHRTLEQARLLGRQPPHALLEGLGNLCRSHEGDTGDCGPTGATCVHTEHYGTRSSTLLQLSEDPTQSELHYADGAPCAHPYQDSSDLLLELSRMASYTEAGSITRTAS